MGMTKEEFTEMLLSKHRPVTEFKPIINYNPDADCLTFICFPDAYKADRKDGLLTLFISRKDGRVIGGRIKEVKSIFDHLCSTKVVEFKRNYDHDGEPIQLRYFLQEMKNLDADHNEEWHDSVDKLHSAANHTDLKLPDLIAA